MNRLSMLIMVGLTSSPVLAEELAKVESLKTIDLREGDVRVSYVLGGGCREHKPKFHIQLKEDEKKRYVGTLNIMDSTDEPDLCDAVVEVSGSANLKDLLKQAAVRQKIDPALLGDVVLELPSVTVGLQ